MGKKGVWWVRVRDGLDVFVENGKWEMGNKKKVHLVFFSCFFAGLCLCAG